MSTPSSRSDPVENPWKKRRKGPQEFMPPSRALLAEKGGLKATATWVRWFNHGWKCVSASKGLRWMRGMTDPQGAKSILNHQGHKWNWIEPNTARVIPPPF